VAVAIPYTEDLVYADQAEVETGVPRGVIRQWASRGRITRYPGDGRSFGNGHFQRTMYNLREIQALAPTYQPAPERAPRHRPGRGRTVAA
jgi:hypothetical protein